MVAAGVLSVGLLGLAGLSGLSLGKNVDANDMTRVTNIAADMTERIQSNRQRVLGLPQYQYGCGLRAEREHATHGAG